MGVHTGDSMTVAPAMTLTDKEYQRLRDAARAVITEIGVETGGSNIQFAVNPDDGRVIVIEMNPRVSRSSALASKATGYPIAKIAAKLAVGYRLDELSNDITQTSAAFEPTIDYVVVKWPRFAFEKFRGADPRLSTQMKSVGEVMSIGRTFKQAVQKAARSLEIGREGLVTLREKVDYRELVARVRDLKIAEASGDLTPPSDQRELELPEATDDELREALLELVRTPLADRLWYIVDALRLGLSVEALFDATKIDRWFLVQLEELVKAERDLAEAPQLDAKVLAEAKALGFSDRQPSRPFGARRRRTCERSGRRSACGRSTRESTAARRSSSPTPPTSTRRGAAAPRRRRPSARRS